ncbi:oligosaccharide flippase family protein [Novosphingobium sp. BL-8A]|uniref:oligosaccharide flippase family protein n=1 Tax=Novosphingobium sp. BL-8A TaxID=3127639 RepID=UPI00375725FA
MTEAVLSRVGRSMVIRSSAKAIFAFTARSLQQVSTLVMTLLAARFLPPPEYGVYGLGIVFIILIQTLTYTGFYQFVLTAREDDALVLSTCFWLIFALVSLASGLLALAAYPLGWLFHSPDLGPVLLLLLLIQPLASIGAWSSAALLRRKAVMLNFQIMFAQNLVALVGGALLLWFWHSLYALVAFRYLRVISGTLLYATFARDWPSWRFSQAIARRATTFSSALYGSRMLDFLALYAADLLLGVLHSPSAVGLYRFGNRLATGASEMLTLTMSNFAITQFGEDARKQNDLARTLARFSGTIALLAGIVAAVLIVFIGDVIPLFFNPAYAAALGVTYAMALRGLAGTGQMLVEPAFSALDRTGWVMLFNLATAVVATTAVVVATPFGLAALAWTQATVVLCATAWAFYLMKNRGGIDTGPAVRNFIGACLLSLAYGLTLYAARRWLLPLLSLPPLPGLAAGLLGATALALACLAIGVRLRLFSLKAFSG